MKVSGPHSGPYGNFVLWLPAKQFGRGYKLISKFFSTSSKAL
jgi:hypothetical protein